MLDYPRTKNGKVLRKELGKIIFSNEAVSYTHDAADDMQCVDLGCRRIITKKKKMNKLSIQYYV